MKPLSKTKSVNSKQKTNKMLAILTLCTLAITLVILGQFFVLDHNNKILEEGTIINGFNVGGMSKNEASVILVDKFTEKADEFELTINHKDDSWTFTKDDFNVKSNVHTVLDLSQNRELLLNEKEKEIDLISQFDKMGGSVNMAFNYIYVGLDEKIENIIKQVETEAIDSTINFNPYNHYKLFEISESVNGLRVDKTKLYSDINEQFITTNKINVDLSFVEEIPTITKEYNESLTQKIATFTTNVADSTGGRKHNVKLALDQFNGFILEPNKEVSFNEIIGEHTIENGYQTATIIYNGQFTDGIGGGICQASTTLYNALLLSGVEINEVHKHSLPVRYVPLGLDAMVAEYTADLKFTNTTEYPMYIHTYYDANSVSVDIYSHKPDCTYKTRSEILETISSNGDKIIPDTEGKYSDKVLFKGEYFRVSYPKEGYEVKAYLQTYRDGELITEEEIRHEIYQPQSGVVIEGAEEVPAGMTPIDTGVKIYSSDT